VTGGQWMHTREIRYCQGLMVGRRGIPRGVQLARVGDLEGDLEGKQSRETP